MTSDVHIWRLCLSTVPAADVLSPDERSRARTFRYEVDRQRFVAARVFMRTVLGRLVEVEPWALRLGYSSHGKPHLLEPANLNVSFNLAYSGDHAILGVTRGVDIGVDLEQVASSEDWRDLAQRFFAPSEVAAIQSLPDARQLSAFYTCWTRKEAFVKALGLGLSHPLDSFDVSVDPEGPARLLSIAGSVASASEWRLEDVSEPPTYAAAVAVRATAVRVVLHGGIEDGW